MTVYGKKGVRPTLDPLTIVSFSVNGNEVVFHVSNLPQKLYSH